MSEGHIVHETTPSTADMRLIGQFMAGHHAESREEASAKSD
jgi:hypothetical protein